MGHLTELLEEVRRRADECTDISVVKEECNSSLIGSQVEKIWRDRRMQLNENNVVAKADKCTKVSVARGAYYRAWDGSPTQAIWERRWIELRYGL